MSESACEVGWADAFVAMADDDSYRDRHVVLLHLTGDRGYLPPRGRA